MSKKKNQIISPPPRLSERSQRIWTDLVPFRARTTARLILLEEALRNLDRANECRGILEHEGLVKGFT